MLRCLALCLLLQTRDAQHAALAANSSRALATRHLLHAPHDHRLRAPLKPNIAFDSYEYDLLNLTTLFDYGPPTMLPADLLVFVGNFAPEKLHRYKRESHSLIGTFDISKMFKKRKYKSKQAEELRPSASSLQGGQPPAAAAAVQPALASAPAAAPAARTLEPVTTTAAHVFTIPTKIIPTETYEATTSQTTVKPKFKAKSTRKSKSASKTTTSAPNNLRREARPAAKKKTSESEALSLWPVKHAAVVEGDIVLGGLMMVCPVSTVRFLLCCSSKRDLNQLLEYFHFN